MEINMELKEKKMPLKAEFQEEVERIVCSNCAEDFLFHLKLREENFTIGLRDILKCIHFAEKQGAVPPLPFEWWLDVETHFRL